MVYQGVKNKGLTWLKQARDSQSHRLPADSLVASKRKATQMIMAMAIRRNCSIIGGRLGMGSARALCHPIITEKEIGSWKNGRKKKGEFLVLTDYFEAVSAV